MKNGSNGERQLARRLDDEGWAVTRTAGSGSAQRASCDVTAINQNAILFIECKTYKEGNEIVNTYKDTKQLKELWEKATRGQPAKTLRRVMPLICFKKDGNTVWHYRNMAEEYVEDGNTGVYPNIDASTVTERLYELLKEASA